MRAMSRVYICLLVAALASHAHAADNAGSIQIKKLPPVAHGVAAFPRLVAGADSAVIERINKALARGDALVRKAAKDCIGEAEAGHAEWQRKVAVTMQGPRFVSFVASDYLDCGGAHPNVSTVALVFDLNTGALVDWAKLLPKLAQRTGTDTAGDGSTLGTISSGRLSDLYRDEEKRVAEYPGCGDALKERELNFILWPDAKKRSLVVEPTGFPHVIAACASAFPIPLKTLRSLAVNVELLKAIEVAK